MLWLCVALHVACVREQSTLSASIAIYRLPAELFGGRFDGKFGVEGYRQEQPEEVLGATRLR